MNVIAFNGSPRKNGNTGSLLEKALTGAASQGAQTELIHLYKYTYKGCISCFACKQKDGKSYGRCAVNDELTPLLEKVYAADVLILGSPFYFSAETGVMRSFMERLWFPPFTYAKPSKNLFQRSIKTAMLYTMNVREEDIPAYGKDAVIKNTTRWLESTFGHCELFLSTDTLQVDDYSKFDTGYFDIAEKKKRHAEVFPKDLQRAFDMGARLARD